MNSIVNKKEIFTMATDPIYIGTGGYTIGRVDNTIVRDPTTKIPKIPGSSIAGTWRYYVALKLQSEIKGIQPDFSEIKSKEGNTLCEKLKKYDWENLNGNSLENQKSKFDKLKEWMKFNGNQVSKITCAGQDNVAIANLNSPDATNKDSKTGHCGHCIVCKSFGYSKADKSWQGMLFFSDLNILFFPVYTRIGVKWITSENILKEAGLISKSTGSEGIDIVFAQDTIEKGKEKGFINLGWLNLPYVVNKFKIDLSNIKDDIKDKDIIIVPDSLVSQIINSNLEVRTSVSIDPITGAAKEGALFTSESIPRGTVFYGEIRLFDKSGFPNHDDLPKLCDIWNAIEDSKIFYETLGIGGMTTRGFGRMRILTKFNK